MSGAAASQPASRHLPADASVGLGLAARPWGPAVAPPPLGSSATWGLVAMWGLAVGWGQVGQFQPPVDTRSPGLPEALRLS